MPSPTTPKPTAIEGPPALFRQPVTFINPASLTGDHWRRMIGGAPIVRACVQTLVMQATGLSWSIQGDDEEAKAYFTKLLETADTHDGGGWEVFSSRVLKDTLEVPFGGAAEIGTFPDGVVAWLSHVDGATMVPTYNQRFPYAQMDPFQGTMHPVTFTPDQIGRVRWQAQTDLRVYGWTITPVQDCLPAIQGLLRADRFWQSFLLDTPPAGILDIPGFDEQEARSWYESWKTMLTGPDAFKIPVLYGRERDDGKAAPAQFIKFAESPGQMEMKGLLKIYAEEVTACFGMTLGDLGLFGQELRLAGATKLMELSKRQGLAKLLRGVKAMIDLMVLPDGLEFIWAEMDLEDELKKAQSKEVSARKIRSLVDSFVLTPGQGRRVALAEEVIPPDILTEEEIAADEGNPETKEEDVEITDEELEGDNAPTGEGVADDLEQRISEESQEQIQAFPTNSKWARKMAATAEKLLAKPRRGFTRARASALITLGMAAFEKEERSFALVARTAADARKALERALNQTNWWKSPRLVDEVTGILVNAYTEGATAQIKTIAAARIKAGLAAVDITTFNLTNPAVLKLITERAGEFIKFIDDGTRNAIVNAVMRGVREGVSSPEIAKSILADTSRKALVETFKNRSLSIVNTEINWAESHAALQEQEELGLTKKRWESIPGIRCPICEANTKQGAVKVSFDYQSVFGTTKAPPAHPSVCHCYITFDKSELKKLGNDVGFWFGG